MTSKHITWLEIVHAIDVVGAGALQVVSICGNILQRISQLDHVDHEIECRFELVRPILGWLI